MLSLEQFINQNKKKIWEEAASTVKKQKQSELREARQFRKGWMKNFKASGEYEQRISDICAKSAFYSETAYEDPDIRSQYQSYVAERKAAEEESNLTKEAIARFRQAIRDRAVSFDEGAFLDGIVAAFINTVKTSDCGAYSGPGMFFPLDYHQTKDPQDEPDDRDMEELVEYFESLKNGRPDQELTEEMLDDLCGEPPLQDILREKFLQANPCVHQLLNGIRNSQAIEDEIDFYISGQIEQSRLLETAAEKISEYLHGLSDEEFLDLNFANDTTGAYEAYVRSLDWTERQKAKKELDERTKAAILTRMPDKIIDLFPLARRMKRKFIVHVGPTNSGKTHAALRHFYSASSGIYLAPLRLLAYEVHSSCSGNGLPCSMVTGEGIIDVPGARHVSSTVEMLDIAKTYDVAVIDEAQMLGDENRGGYWTTAILGVAARQVHICTAPEGVGLVERLIGLCGDEIVVSSHRRSTPLIQDEQEFAYPGSVRKGDALIVFSRRDAIHLAANLQRLGKTVSIVYGALPYEARLAEVERFSTGETDILVSTDAIGMGLNLPVKRIVFMQDEKYDGSTFRKLRTGEILQIAGRAGRFGVFDEGEFTGSGSISSFLRKMARKAPDAVESSSITFPSSLLSLDMPLSDIIENWNSMQMDVPFIKNMQLDSDLCRELEKEISDKRAVYNFLTLPFDRKNETCVCVWWKCVGFETKNQGNVTKSIMRILDGRIFEITDDLAAMETSYKICDILYGYCRKFGRTELLDAISARREAVSSAIIEYLREEDLPVRTCSKCGEPLPLFHSYGICDECHFGRYFDDRD